MSDGLHPELVESLEHHDMGEPAGAAAAEREGEGRAASGGARTRRHPRPSPSRGMISTKLQGRWR